jgi:hypothetical protein
VRNSDPTANVFDVISLSYSTKKLSIHQVRTLTIPFIFDISMTYYFI